MNETALAALNYRIEHLERELADVRKRLTLALAQVETYKAKAIEEHEARKALEAIVARER